MATLFRDTFTDTPGTLLVNHTPETDTVGGGWVADLGTAEISSDGTSGICSSFYSGVFVDVGVADYEVTCELLSVAFGGNSSLAFRVVSRTSMWLARINDSNDSLELVKWQNGSNVIDSAVIPGFSRLTPYTVKVTCDGDDITVEIESESLVLSTTDAFQNTATRVAPWNHAGHIDNKFDNFRVDELGGGGTDPITGTAVLVLEGQTVEATGDSGGTSVVVNNTTELNAAIDAAVDGTIILLNDGTYTSLNRNHIDYRDDWTSPITLMPNAGQNNVVLGGPGAGPWKWYKFRGVNFRGLYFYSPVDKDTGGFLTYHVDFLGCDRVEITDCEFEGLDPGVYHEDSCSGLQMSSSTTGNNSYIRIQRCKFHGFYAACQVLGNGERTTTSNLFKDVLIEDCEFYHSHVDHLMVGHYDGMTIRRCEFHSHWKYGGGHPDCIQMLASNTNNTLIEDCRFYRNGQAESQTVFANQSQPFWYVTCGATSTGEYGFEQGYTTSLLEDTKFRWVNGVGGTISEWRTDGDDTLVLMFSTPPIDTSSLVCKIALGQQAEIPLISEFSMTWDGSKFVGTSVGIKSVLGSNLGSRINFDCRPNDVQPNAWSHGNVTARDNMIWHNNHQGISMGWLSGTCLYENNTVLPDPVAWDEDYRYPWDPNNPAHPCFKYIPTIAGSGWSDPDKGDFTLDVRNNVGMIFSIDDSKPEITSHNNYVATYEDPKAESYFTNHFPDPASEVGSPADMESWHKPRIDGALFKTAHDGGDIGRMQQPLPPTELNALVTASTSLPLENRTVTFNGSQSGGDTIINHTWDFGDGTVINNSGHPGIESHAFANQGMHVATLTVNSSSGSDTQRVVIDVMPELIFGMDFEGNTDNLNPDVTASWVGTPTYVAGVNGQAMRASAAPDYIKEDDKYWLLYGLEAFTIEFDWRKEGAWSSTYAVYNHTRYYLQVTDDRFTFRLYTPSIGQADCTVNGTFGDGNWHKIRVEYDGQELRGFHDDTLETTVAASGIVEPPASWILVLGGSEWNWQGQDIDNFRFWQTESTDDAITGSRILYRDDVTVEITGLNLAPLSGTVDTQMDGYTVDAFGWIRVDGEAALTLDGYSVSGMGLVRSDGVVDYTLNDALVVAGGSAGQYGPISYERDGATVAIRAFTLEEGGIDVVLGGYSAAHRGLVEQADVTGGVNYIRDGATVAASGIPGVYGSVNFTLLGPSVTASGTVLVTIQAQAIFTLDGYRVDAVGDVEAMALFYGGIRGFNPAVDPIGQTFNTLQGNYVPAEEPKYREGDQYGAEGVEFTGSYDIEGDWIIPEARDVEEGVLVGRVDSPETGTFVVPAEADVRLDVGYGDAGVEFRGTLVVGSSGNPTNPVLPSGELRSPLWIGYEYLTSNGTGFAWTVTFSEALDPNTIFYFRGRCENSCGDYDWDVEHLNAVTADNITWELQFDLTEAETEVIREGIHDWWLVATDSVIRHGKVEWKCG